jgi:signal transduction histidine kinase
LRLEADVFRLFKQHSDALLVGDRRQDMQARELQARIKATLAGIRDVIAREIELVGEEEIEELALLDEIENDVRQIHGALSRLSDSGEPMDKQLKLDRLAQLLDREIDLHLTELLTEALAEEVEELEEVKAQAALFRLQHEVLVYLLLAVGLALLIGAVIAFGRQVRMPLHRLQTSMARLRNADYSAPHDLGGSLEFRELSDLLDEMARSLSAREASHDEQNRRLEEAVQSRTKELQALITRLETGEESRKRLMADISHELRTPLTIILGEANVALRTARDLDDDVSDALARIRDSAKHTNQLVDDMLTVARQEAGHLRLDLRVTDVRSILADAAEIFPHEVVLRMPDDEARLAVDQARLRQCVLALLHNAQRYGGTTICATLSDSPEALSIVVEDNGVGLRDDEKERAFERFFRGSNAAGYGSGGTGLGLPVVKSITEAHGGRVILEDSELGGLAVRLELTRPPAIRAVNSEHVRKIA